MSDTITLQTWRRYYANMTFMTSQYAKGKQHYILELSPLDKH